MLPPLPKQFTHILTGRVRTPLFWIGVIILGSLSLGLQSCADSLGLQEPAVSGVVLDHNGSPVSGAAVRVQATTNSATSDAMGRFTLPISQTEQEFNITAWAAGYYIGGPVLASSGDADIEIKLQPHAVSDNTNYEWLSVPEQSNMSEDIFCAKCHSSDGEDHAASLPVEEWQLDAHANTAVNPRFLSMYTGTDTLGNQSPPTRYVSKKDYGTEPVKPDPDQPYYGPGYKLDFPDTAGNCATCHTPAAAIANPYDTDPTNLQGVDAQGISCDFCHKIWDVVLDPHSGLPYQNMPGVLSYHFRRPPEGHQFFAGPFDDVAPGEDTYSALQTQGQFCAPCHHGVFWDVLIYDSFGEWLRSSYSDPDNGQTCQDCHMPPLGVDHFALEEQGGLIRDPATIFSHRMPGASDETLLQNAVSMTVTAELEEGILQVQVKLTNDRTGHDVPTDSPLRHLILLVSVQDERGQPLTLNHGPRIPDWCGVGDPDEGYYAGLPGMVYAKVLAEQWTNVSPTAAYWNPTYLVSDNRLAPFSSDITNYAFETANEAQLQIRARLLYRRAFIELAGQKSWQIPDILMEETIMEIVP